MADINDILSHIDELPALPATVLQIVGMLNGDRASVGEIEHAARCDEALSATVLRCANSAQYGRPGRVFNLKDSIVRLGGSVLMKVVLQQKVSRMFARGGAAFGLGRGALWRGALGGAVATESICRRCGFADADLAFLCTLLRDVGKLALDTHYGHRYISLLAEHLRDDRTFVEAERLALGFDHSELGAALVLRWGLPERIADAIRHHHDPPADDDAHDRLFDVVHAADIIALWAGLAVGYDGMQYRLAEHVRLGMKINRIEAEMEIADTSARLRQIEDLMNEPLSRAA